MCYFIGIEDLVANALIELVEQTGNRTISFSQLNRYGEVVMTKLKEEQKDVMLIYNRDATEQFFHDCSNIFTINDTESDVQITLNESINTEYLRRKFRINIALNLLSAFISPEAISVILGARS